LSEDEVDRDGDETPGAAGHDDGISRRKFIQGATVLGGAAVIDAALASARAITGAPTAVSQGVLGSVVGEIQSVISDTKPTFSILLRRRDDFLFLRVDGYNLTRTGQRLEREFGGFAAYIVFTFEPQHITEQAFLDPGQTPKLPGGSKALMAYPSRIAFSLPEGASIPLTVKGLLHWAALQPSLSPSAEWNPSSRFFISPDARPRRPGGGIGPIHVPRPKKPPKIARPTQYETAIELPWHLAISPTSTGGKWSHPVKPITGADGWTELWHTRLAADAGEAATDGGTIRAVWAYDQNFNPKSAPPNVDTPFITSLNPFYRWQIVNATSNFDYEGKGRADVTARKLWLSSRGGFLDSIGDWDLQPKLGKVADLAEWKHLATLARDHYVKIVEKGFLFPFGHRVVLTIVTERLFEQVGGEIVATSRQISYLVVRQPEKSYDPAQTFGVANNSRDLPFRSLTLKTLRTPDLDPRTRFEPSIPENDVFVPYVSGAPFQWHFVGTDWNGNDVAFTAPGVFVIQDDALTPDLATAVRDQYNGLGDSDPVRTGQFTGSEVAFAASHKAGDTNLSVQSISFGAGVGTGPTTGSSLDNSFADHDQPLCYPNVHEAVVTLSAAAQAAGGAPLASNPTVSYHPTFVSDDFNSPGNLGNLFMQIVNGAPPLNFGQGSSGGVITPNLVLSGLSRSLGPVAGDVGNILGGDFDPTSVFAGALDANILGGVKLIDLIKLISGFSGDNPVSQVMQIAYDTVGSAGMAADVRGRARDVRGLAGDPPPIPTTKTTHFHWEPDIVDNNPIVSKDPSATYGFTLDGTVTADLLHPDKSTFSLDGELKGFIVTLMTNQDSAAEFIGITFNELSFKAGNGQKSSVNVDIKQVQFLGVLEFIQQLQDFMDFSGDGGPKIEIQPDGISADLAVALPPIEVGVFSLSNIAIDAGFNLPFTGKPARFRFSFSTQDNPFTLSVAIFGGGGFFGIAIGTDGVELIQASFDFGAMASIDLGVASGSVQLVAGIYFSYGQMNGKPPTTCILTGFVKLDGELSILGIITISLTFDLSLTYQTPPSEVTGTATLTVSVKVVFFSFSVSVTATKTWGGGSDGTNKLQGHATSRLLPHFGGTDVAPTFADQMSQTDWAAYAAAFANS
jgi:hypothetical protein